MARIIITRSSGGPELEVDQTAFNNGFFPGFVYVRNASGSPTSPLTPLAADMNTVLADSTSAPSATLRAALVPFWTAAEAVTSTTVRMAPDGHVILSNGSRTTRGSYDATEQGNWTVVGGGGTTGALLAASNLSDLANAGTARTNLGLGSAATAATSAFDAAGAATAAQAAAVAASAPRLIPTATKTATYTAAVGDLAMMDVAGGATTLTLPTAPADKSQVGYLAIGATPAAPLTVNRGGAATIGTAAATSITVPLANEVTVYQYDAANTRWLPVSNVKPLTALDGRYLKAWTPSTAYALNDVVSNSGQLYTANSAFTSGASFSGANWTQITGTALTYTGQQTDVLRGDGSWAMPNAPSAFAYSCDMMQTLNSAAPWPWVIQTFASGSWGAATAQATANHPGVTKLTSSTTANSGSFIGTQSGQVQLGGGEETSVIFQLPTVTGAIGYFGFHSANSATAPVFGVWADISGATLTGKANDGTLVTTGTSATLAINTWYRLRVIAVSATQANFYLYDCATGALLWSDVVASHAQPTALLYHSFLVGNSGTTVQDIAYVDYLSMRINRVLTR